MYELNPFMIFLVIGLGIFLARLLRVFWKKIPKLLISLLMLLWIATPFTLYFLWISSNYGVKDGATCLKRGGAAYELERQFKGWQAVRHKIC